MLSPKLYGQRERERKSAHNVRAQPTKNNIREQIESAAHGENMNVRERKNGDGVYWLHECRTNVGNM